MSTQTKLGKLISRFEIGFDDETKVVIDSLKDKLDEVTRALSVKNDSHGDRLLAAMQAEAANDAPITSSPREDDLKRATINDVDYLSDSDLDESVPTIQDMEAGYTILDETRNYWQAESVPQITQADMQLIFIKNLSETLIQRMHSMDRFSEDDYHIGGTNLMPWDIVTGEYNDKVVYGVVAGTQVQADRDTNKIDIVRLKPKFLISENHVSIGAITSIYFDSNDSFCTITEAELPAFRAALEACYA